MSKLTNLIDNYSQQNLISFLREKIQSLKPIEDNLDYMFQEAIFEKYESIEKLGEATIKKDDIVIIATKTTDPLTERTGKKNQYEIAKKVLKHEVKDAALFVFYDSEGNFRFSFVKANYLGTKREFTEYKRYSYFVSPNQSNKTFIHQVGDCGFNSLDEIIQSFSVEPLNKEFYQEIAKAFYELIGGKFKQGSRTINSDNPQLTLPSTPSINNRKIYQEFAVRLIGRTIFCWFLKNKKSDAGIPLIPETWLSSNTVVEVNNQQHNYYHAILEKLFFLVLNKREEERKDYELPHDANIIPFLNGGLFEAHPDDFFPTDSKGIHQIAFGLKIPNTWFLELFKVLEQYNFTIDENSIYDAEVSIDPEMLGTIFENLLAEIDPDTEKSARKATGSFYTPREIVDYMVEQSLVQYLITKTSIQDEQTLERLFKEGQETNNESTFDSGHRNQILQALSDVKILDPACGSGAFPMGALHKIVLALKKLDPGAKWWKQKQLEKVSNALLRSQLKEKLDAATSDYARKLGVIQHSIYGVDIQPIASEISKLRSFLSLVIDENIDDNAVNRGIEPLPNLEFKFVTANTLIGLPEEQGQQTSLFDNYEELQLLEQLRTDYLQSSGKKKEKIKEHFLKVQKRAFKNEHNLFADTNSRSYKLISWNPFSNEASTWFDPQWMYGVEKFDIVIGNPPYVFTRDVDFGSGFKEYVSDEYFKDIALPNKSKSRQAGKINLFAIFLLKGKKLIHKDGNLIYIIPNNILRGTVYDVIRYELLINNDVISIVDLGAGIFSKVTASTILLQLGNKSISDYGTEVITNVESLQEDKFETKYINQNIFLNNTSYTFNIMLNKEQLALSNKIKHGRKSLGEYCIDIIEGIVAHKHLILDKKEDNSFDLIEGKDIKRFFIQESSNFILWNKNEIHRTRPDYLWQQHKKIVMQRISGGTMPLVAAIDLNKRKAFASTNNIILVDKYKDNYEFFTCLLNSKLINWYYANNFSNNSKLTVNISKTFLETLPIHLPEDSVLSKINELHDLLESTYGNEFFNENYGLLNLMIYKLYNLTHQEVLLIDPKFTLTEGAYNNYKI